MFENTLLKVTKALDVNIEELFKPIKTKKEVKIPFIIYPLQKRPALITRTRRLLFLIFRTSQPELVEG